MLAGTVQSHRDIIAGMSKSMSTMGYYLTMIFFCAQFTAAFAQSNLGALLAVEGAEFLKALGLPGMMTIGGICRVERVGKPARWIGIREVGLASTGVRPGPDAGRALPGTDPSRLPGGRFHYKYRHASDAVFSARGGFLQRWVKNTGIGTVTSLMLPYSISLLITWSLVLGLYWALGIPLGLQSTYTYP